jgi:hypothetical protein
MLISSTKLNISDGAVSDTALLKILAFLTPARLCSDAKLQVRTTMINYIVISSTVSEELPSLQAINGAEKYQARRKPYHQESLIDT